MRILVISPYYPPGIGGACRLLHGFVEHLVKDGHLVEVLAYGEPFYKECVPFDKTQNYTIWRVSTGYPDSKTIVRTGMFVFSLLLRRRYDRIFTGVAYPSAVLAFLATILLPCPYVVYSHGEDASIVKDSGWKRRLLTKALMNAREVMVNSRFTAGEIDFFGIPPSKVLLAPPGIDPDPYLAVTDDMVAQFRAEHNLTGKRILLTVARLDERKGHDTIIRLLPDLSAAIPDLHYLVIGGGDAERLKKLAAEAGVAERLTVLNYVTEEGLKQAYTACEIFTMVSRLNPDSKEVEGFGMVYLEAGACGKPSVAGSAGGSAEAVLNNETGLVVDPTNLPEIKAALLKLFCERELAAKLGAAARQRVLDSFRSDNIYAMMETHLTAKR